MPPMHPTSEQTRAIRDYFKRHRDRAARYPNPLFAGRDEEMNTILAQAEILDRSDVPEPNMTALVYGAPGAGKSEILVQLKAALHATESENPPIVIDANSDTLFDAGAFTTALYHAAPASIQHRLRDRGWSLNTATMKFGPLGLTAQRDPAAPTGDTESSKLTGVGYLLKEANGGVAPMVVLMVDEAQAKLANAAVDSNFMLSLHEGLTGLKALTVYGGLGNTPDALADCGVSRPGDEMMFALRRLKDEVVRGIAAEALAATTDRPPHIIDEWADTIAAFADGWPAHMNTVIRAVADRARTNDWRLDSGGFNAAMTQAGKRRREYYSARLKRCKSLDTTQYGRWAAMMSIHKEVTPAVVGAKLGLDLPGAKALVDDAVAAGLMDPALDGRYISPTPSLTAHIERAADPRGGGTALGGRHGR